MTNQQKNRQPQTLSFEEILSLPVLADAYTDTGRVNNITLNKMKAFYSGINIYSGNTAQAQVDVSFVDSDVLVEGAAVQFDMAGITSWTAEYAAIVSAVLSYASGKSYSITEADIVGLSGDVRSFSNPSLAINTSRQPSTMRDTMVNAAVDITTILSLSGGTAGKVELKYADDTGLTTNVKTVQGFTNSNTGTLTIGLNTSQIGTANLTGIIPAGKYYRLVTTNVTGTPTYGTPVIQEVLL